jgi:hypothetical protein
VNRCGGDRSDGRSDPFTYDGNRNLLTVSDASSHTTTWTTTTWTMRRRARIRSTDGEFLYDENGHGGVTDKNG